MSFSPDEIEAMEETAKALEWWAEVGWQYTTTNCEADKMSMADMFFSIQSGGETSKNVTCRYQISLHNALSKFEIFYERMLHDNETQAKYIKEKYEELKEYTKDTNNPDRQAPWIARERANYFAGSLRKIAEMAQRDVTPQNPGDTISDANCAPESANNLTEEKVGKAVSDVAWNVDGLVRQSQNMERFREMVRQWYKELGGQPCELLPFTERSHSLAEMYAMLAAIHDHYCKGVEEINPWPSSSLEVLSTEGTQYFALIFDAPRLLSDKDKNTLENHLYHVKADLASKNPAETKQDTTPDRGKIKKIIGWIFKKAWHLISTIIFILAALLTCLYYLGWLEQIKAFIYNILRSK